MKAYIVFFLILLHIPLFSTKKTFPKSKITHVTVFPKGAMVTRKIDVQSLRGSHVIQIKNLPLTVNKKSIVVEAGDNIEIISINSQIENKYKYNDLKFKTLEVKNQSLQDSVMYYQTLINVLDKEKYLITEHDDFTNDDNQSDIEEVIKASDFYRKRIKEIELELLSLRKNIYTFHKELEILEEQNDSLLQFYSMKHLTVNIKLDLGESPSHDITLQYFVPNATWYPYYDLKVNSLEAQPFINRKAYVSQNTGEDWKDVKVALSNANPLSDKTLPSLLPKNLSLSNHILHSQNNTSVGIIKDQEGNPLIGANVYIDGTRIGTSTNIDGSFSLHNSLGKTAVVSYLGYNPQLVKLESGVNDITLYEETEMLSEVMVVGSSSGSNISYDKSASSSTKKDLYKQLRKKEGKAFLRKAISTTKIEAINSVEYIIEKPYSIKSNDEEIDMLIETTEINCIYEHLAIPLKSEKTFLILKIPDWHKLDLLSGQVNLFLSNTYKGTSKINPNITLDTISISMGADPEVVVERKLIKELYDKKFFRKNIEEHFTYETTIKNNKSTGINLKILDQVPVSTHEDIEIKTVDFSGGNLNEDTGEIMWNLNLFPGGSQKKKLTYSVKYPTAFALDL